MASNQIEIPFQKWNDLEIFIRQIEQENENAIKTDGGYRSNILFRGQNNAAFELKSTLERNSEKIIQLNEYYQWIKSQDSELRVTSGKHWDDIDLRYVDEMQNNYDGHPIRYGKPVAYEFLVFLRHHGFASPLLDWTRNYLIAAHFAFENSPTEATHTAIFIYQSHTGNGKFHCSNKSQILNFGHNIVAHERHTAQKAQYTMSIQFTNSNGWCFMPYSESFASSPETQDKWWKLTIPITEKQEVLKQLEKNSINKESLFEANDELKN